MTVTNTATKPIFHLTTEHTRAVVVALVTLTLSVARAFSVARCPHCRTLVMAMPGPHKAVEVREFPNAKPFGESRGRVIRCPTRRCQRQLEVIEHE